MGSVQSRPQTPVYEFYLIPVLMEIVCSYLDEFDDSNVIRCRIISCLGYVGKFSRIAEFKGFPINSIFRVSEPEMIESGLTTIEVETNTNGLIVFGPADIERCKIINKIEILIIGHFRGSNVKYLSGFLAYPESLKEMIIYSNNSFEFGVLRSMGLHPNLGILKIIFRSLFWFDKENTIRLRSLPDSVKHLYIKYPGNRSDVKFRIDITGTKLRSVFIDFQFEMSNIEFVGKRPESLEFMDLTKI